MIPRRIIQTFRSRYTWPPVWVDCFQRVRDFHPDWEIIGFTDDEARAFLDDHCPELREMFDLYPRTIQRADLFRIIAVHQLGGFYLDMDLWLHRALDPLVAESLVVPEEWTMESSYYQLRHRCPPRSPDYLRQIGNYAFGAEQGHPMLDAVITEMMERTAVLAGSMTSDDDVLFSTGPDVLNAVFHSRKDDLAPDARILEGNPNRPAPAAPEAWGPKSWFQFGEFGNHLMTGVWRG